MSSHMCDICLKVLNNYINWRLGTEKLDKSLRKPCVFSAYPYKSCREHIALNVIQDEFVSYLEKEVAHNRLERLNEKNSEKSMRQSDHDTIRS